MAIAETLVDTASSWTNPTSALSGVMFMYATGNIWKWESAELFSAAQVDNKRVLMYSEFVQRMFQPKS